MPKPLYVSFFTRGNGYEEEARQLVQTLEEFHLEYEVHPVIGHDNWQSACQHKAIFVRDQMRKHPGRPVVWVDADARIKAPPVMFDGLECDVGTVWRDGTELLAGTIYFGPTAAAMAVANRWIEENQSRPDNINGDQKNFQNVIERMERAGEANIFRLPQTYCQVFDLMRHVGEPVILQTQASRRLRR